MRLFAIQTMLAATALSLVIVGPTLGQGTERGSGSGSAGAMQTAPGQSAPDVRGPASNDGFGPAGPSAKTTTDGDPGDREGAGGRAPDATNMVGPLGWVLTLAAGIGVALVVFFLVRGPLPGRRRGPTT